MKKQYWSLLALAAVVLLTVGGFASCSNDDDDDSDSGSTSSSTSVELSASVGTNELAGLTLTRVFRIYYGDGLSGGRGYIKYVFSDTEMGYYYMETAEDAEAPSFDDRPLCMKYTTLVIPTKKPLLTSAMRHTLTALHTRRQVAI